MSFENDGKSLQKYYDIFRYKKLNSSVLHSQPQKQSYTKFKLMFFYIQDRISCNDKYSQSENNTLKKSYSRPKYYYILSSCAPYAIGKTSVLYNKSHISISMTTA